MGQKIIEVIGPPGVGKTSIYRSLCYTCPPDAGWTYQDALLAPARPGIGEFPHWLKYQASCLLGKKMAKAIPAEFGVRFVQENKELAQFFWDHLSNPEFGGNGEPAHRFRSAYFLFSDFCRYQAIRENACSKPCIIDEGFLQKSFLLPANQQALQDLIDRYLALLPLPYALVYIDTPHKHLISDRLQHRKKRHLTHIGKDEAGLLEETEKWQYLLQTILEKTEHRNVLTYKIDGAKPIAVNVNLIKEFLAAIN